MVVLLCMFAPIVDDVHSAMSWSCLKAEVVRQQFRQAMRFIQGASRELHMRYKTTAQDDIERIHYFVGTEIILCIVRRS